MFLAGRKKRRKLVFKGAGYGFRFKERAMQLIRGIIYRIYA